MSLRPGATEHDQIVQYVEAGKEHEDEGGLGRDGPKPGIGCWGFGPLSYTSR